jgi:hypothetical protein
VTNNRPKPDPKALEWVVIEALSGPFVNVFHSADAEEIAWLVYDPGDAGPTAAQIAAVRAILQDLVKHGEAAEYPSETCRYFATGQREDDEDNLRDPQGAISQRGDTVRVQLWEAIDILGRLYPGVPAGAALEQWIVKERLKRRDRGTAERARSGRAEQLRALIKPRSE